MPSWLAGFLDHYFFTPKGELCLVLIGVLLGSSIGMVGKSAMLWRQRGSLRLLISLWEWARQNDDAENLALHARRIQRYYRQIRQIRSVPNLLAVALLGFSMAVMVATFSTQFLALSVWFSPALLLMGMGMAAAACLTVVWVPAGMVFLIGEVVVSSVVLVIWLLHSVQ